MKVHWNIVLKKCGGETNVLNCTFLLFLLEYVKDFEKQKVLVNPFNGENKKGSFEK